MVISSKAFNEGQQDAIFLLITSNASRVAPSDLLVDEKHLEFGGTGLKKTSVFRIGRIHTLTQRLAYSRLGSIGPQLRGEIVGRLKDILSLS